MLKKIGGIFRVLLFLFIGGCFVLLVWGEIDRTIAEKSGRFGQQPSQYPIRQSDITMYTDGKQLNNQLFSDIEKAKQYVHINFFSIADDKVSHQFLQLLRQKSQEGVEVYYALDRLGGILLKKKERELLVKKGVHFTYYNKPDFPYLFSSLDHRNHRRISVIDGKIGYIGGFNIGKKYFFWGRKKLVIGEISIFKYEEKEFKI
ncbi:phospholipase D-like domain-containing protein [Bacillus mycoides]|nr:phospholipase D-like domain-containing protein [Bacillus mycoides]